MTAATIHEAYRAVNLGTKNPIIEPAKTGTLSSHRKASIILLSAATVAAIAATIAAAIFAHYALVVAGATAILTLSIITLVTGRIQISKGITDLMKALIKKVQDQFQQLNQPQKTQTHDNDLIKQHQNEINRLKKQLQDKKTTTVKNENEQEQRLQAKLNELTKNYDELLKHIKEIQEESTAKDQRILALQTPSSQNEEQTSPALSKEADLLKELDELKKKYEAARKAQIQLLETKKELSNYIEELKALKISYQELKDEEENQKNHNDLLKQTNTLLDGQITNANNKINELNGIINTKNEEIKRLEAELTASKIKEQKATGELTSANIQINKLISEINANKLEIQRLKAELGKLKNPPPVDDGLNFMDGPPEESDTQKLQNKIKVLEEKLASGQDQVDEIDTLNLEIKGLKTQLAQVMAEKKEKIDAAALEQKRLEDRITGLEKTIGEKAARIIELNEKIEQLNIEKEAVKKDAEGRTLLVKEQLHNEQKKTSQYKDELGRKASFRLVDDIKVQKDKIEDDYESAVKLLNRYRKIKNQTLPDIKTSLQILKDDISGKKDKFQKEDEIEELAVVPLNKKPGDTLSLEDITKLKEAHDMSQKFQESILEGLNEIMRLCDLIDFEKKP